MRWQLVGLVVLVGISGVRADVPPRPPEPLPKGKKLVDLDNRVVLGQGVAGYVFSVETLRGPGAPRRSYSPAKVNPDTEYAFTCDFGRHRGNHIIAVPEAAAKTFQNIEDLHTALAGRKVSGVESMDFTSARLVDEKETRAPFRLVHTIAAIGKDGIWFTTREVGGPQRFPCPAPRRRRRWSRRRQDCD